MLGLLGHHEDSSFPSAVLVPPLCRLSVSSSSELGTPGSLPTAWDGSGGYPFPLTSFSHNLEVV